MSPTGPFQKLPSTCTNISHPKDLDDRKLGGVLAIDLRLANVLLQAISQRQQSSRLHWSNSVMVCYQLGKLCVSFCTHFVKMLPAISRLLG